jgi:hypothetical protein
MPSVPGKGGAMPKRSTERMGHRSKEEKAAVQRVQVAGAVVIPPADPEWHYIARQWYESLAASGQAQFYEPSDWAAAMYVAEAMTSNLDGAKFSSQLFGAVWTAMNDLLTTEGSRRRVRLELERTSKEAAKSAKSASVLAEYRRNIAA